MEADLKHPHVLTSAGVEVLTSTSSTRGQLRVHDGVRDDDLVKRIADATPFLRPAIESVCTKEQQRRDALAVLPTGERRRAIIGHRLTEETPDKKDLRHIHSVLAICAMPYARLPEDQRVWERQQGQMRLVVKAGSIASPDGKWIPQPVPFGPRSRLVMMHTCSEAIMQKSPTIEVEDSLCAFIRSMGLTATGGKYGTIAGFKTQIQAISVCAMQIGIWNGTRAKTINTQPFSSIDVWFPKEKGATHTWSSTLTFSREFYDTLTKHALPVNVHAVRAFANSARKLDLLFWLGYRMNAIEKPVTIPWSSLKEQFGPGYTRDRKFREDFADEIHDIMDVFPKLPVKLTDTGFIIHPGTSEVLSLPKFKR